MVNPARCRTFWVAEIGPKPMQLGSTPATAVARILARGLGPPVRLSARPTTRSAAAPSLIPLELAAVTVPPLRNAGLSCATASRVVPARGYSSLANVVPSGRGTGTSSSVNTQSLSARAARPWLSTANASCSARPARHLDRQAGDERRHAGDVAVILARLVGTSEDHVVDARRLDARPLDHRLDRDRRQIVGAHGRQRPTVLADGGTERSADERVSHKPIQTVLVSV